MYNIDQIIGNEFVMLLYFPVPETCEGNGDILLVELFILTREVY